MSVHRYYWYIGHFVAMLSIVSIRRVNSNINWIKILIPNHLKIKKLYYMLQNCYMPKMYLFIKINENQLINRSFK